MNCADTFSEKISLLGIRAKTSDEVIHSLGALLLKEGYVKETYIQNVLDREKEFATGLPLGNVNVALPHTDSIHVNQQGIAVGVLDTPVDFHVMGKPDATVPVRLVFLMAIKESNDQVDLLQMLAVGLQDPAFVDSLLCAQSTQEIITTLHTWFTN